MITKCDFCKKRSPTINVQKVWIKWDYDSHSYEYANPEILTDIKEPTGDENLHLCKTCFEKWKNGEEI